MKHIRIQQFVSSSCCLFSVIILMSFAQTFAQEVVYTASELAKLRDVYWKSIFSIDMEYTEEFIFQRNKRVELPANRWSMDNKRERVIYYGLFQETAYSDSAISTANSKHERDEIHFFYKNDMYFSENMFYSIESQGNKIDEILNIPQFKSTFDFLKSYIIIDIHKEKTDSYESMCPADWWLMFRQFVPTFGSVLEKRETFEYFVNNRCKTTPPVQSKKNNGDTIWTFTLHPRLDSNKNFFEVVINENKGFFLERVTTHSFEGSKKINERLLTGLDVIVDFIVEEYAEIDSNHFFPKVFIEQCYFSGDKPEDGYKKTYRIKNISINKPIDDSVFDFRIPEHAIVRYQPPSEKDNEKFLIKSIWGADNKPAITFTEPDGLNKYLEKLYKVTPQTGTPASLRFVDYCWRIVCCVLGLIFIVVSILLSIKKTKKVNEK